MGPDGPPASGPPASGPPGSGPQDSGLGDAELDALATLCAEAARVGGAVLLDWRGRIRAREKGPRDLVTEADLASQAAIQGFLQDRRPDFVFVGEEDPRDLDRLTGETPCWVVDPLDGTTNFVHGMPAFAVSVALAQRGEVLAGAVYDPVAGELFQAARGRGATLQAAPLHVEPQSKSALRASDCRRLADALVAASFSANVRADSEEVRQFVRMLERCQAVRRLGSAALNLCYVAAGRLDAYWATAVKAWDMAAGWLLVQEAGGAITHVSGAPLGLARPELAAAATEELHSELMGLLA